MAAQYTQITYEVVGAVAVVSLDRPAVRNAVSLTMTTELDQAFTAACRDHAVRCIVLRANGQHFSSGHDLGSDSHMLDLTARGYAPGPRGDLEKWNETDTEMCLKWRQLPKPIICGVKGYTIYHGTALLAISDIAVAAEDLLYMPSLIEYNSLPWETSLNAKRSKEILFTQRFVMAAEAASLGIVNHVVAAADLDTELMKIAEQVSTSDPMHLWMMKRMVNTAQEAAGLETFARASLNTWATWRWHSAATQHSGSGDSAAATRDHGGSIKKLAPVKEALAGIAFELSKNAEARAKL